MKMGRRVLAILSQSRRFYNSWQPHQRKPAAIPYRCSFNLQKNQTLLVQNVNSRGMSLANLPLPKHDLNTFLEHIVDAYVHGKKTEFKELLQNRLIKNLLDERIRILENIRNLEELEADKEMKKLAEEERITNESQLKQLDDDLINLIFENLIMDNYDDVIIELTAGVGGQEAMLFVRDLLGMYMKHLAYLKYNFDIIELDDSSEGGVRHASLMVSGTDAFKKLQHEAGVHRVQRVPVTEKSGRIHTSAVSVAVLPQPSEIDVVINSKDLRVDTMRATGAGGQHVNTTDSAVRIVHLPTGIVVECQTQRSQLKNRNLAMAKLRAKIYEGQLNEQLKYTSTMRKQQMGMGERNEKIRTYNFSQDRVTDHRLPDGTLHNLKGFLSGGEALNKFHEKLHQELVHKIFIEAVKSVR